MSHPTANHGRVFPRSIRADLVAAANARHRQLSALIRVHDPGDVVAAAHRNSVARILGEVLAALDRLDPTATATATASTATTGSR